MNAPSNPAPRAADPPIALRPWESPRRGAVARRAPAVPAAADPRGRAGTGLVPGRTAGSLGAARGRCGGPAAAARSDPAGADEGAAKLDRAATDDVSYIACPMCAPIEDCVALALSDEQTRPLIPCEYSHAMGNGNGTLSDTWAAIEATPGLQGGFIRESRDHGILQRVNDGRPAGRGGAGLYDNGVAAPGQRWAYGGDFGEAIHDGAFIADGVVFPDLIPKPVSDAAHRGLGTASCGPDASPSYLVPPGVHHWSRTLRVL